MNMFESWEGFCGHVGTDSMGGSLQSLLMSARDIRTRLGKKAYLLDHYLSLFLEGANAMLAYEAAESGFDSGCELRGLCFDAINQTKAQEDHPFYATVNNTLSTKREMLSYEEKATNVNLLYVTLSDAFLPFALKCFLREADFKLGIVLDFQELIELYEQISAITGEAVMERFNLRLKQRFLVAPLVSVFVQGFTNDLLYCLSSRDSETSKQVFQLMMDSGLLR